MIILCCYEDAEISAILDFKHHFVENYFLLDTELKMRFIFSFKMRFSRWGFEKLKYIFSHKAAHHEMWSNDVL